MRQCNPLPEVLYQDVPIHPGRILKEEFMIPFAISAYQLSRDIRRQRDHIGQIIRGTRGISPDFALRLSRYFGTTPQYWLNLQAAYDLAIAREHAVDLDEVVVYARPGDWKHW